MTNSAEKSDEASSQPTAIPEEPKELNQIAEQYRRSVEDLDPATSTSVRETLLRALLIRDEIAGRLTKAQLSPDEFSSLIESDELLKRAVKRMAFASHMEKWRSSILPPDAAWWWHMDEPPKSSWWTLLEGLILTIAISITAEASMRFLANGPDFYSVFTTGVQALLALAV